MGDSEGGSSSGDGVGGISGGVNFAADFVRAMQMFMGQQAMNMAGQGATKALRDVISKNGRFDGKNITGFLRAYTCEMEIYQVPEARMIETFDLAVVPEIRERVRELHGAMFVNTWERFAERLKEEYFDEDSQRMSKRAFLEWVEMQPGKNMGPNELLREFEKKYGQLPLSEKRLLDTRKSELFLQAADDVLEDRLLLILQDVTAEGGFDPDWRRLEESLSLITKQQRVKARGVISRGDVPSASFSKTPASSVSSTPSSSSGGRVLDNDTLEDLVKGIKELRVEMSALKKGRMTSESRPSEGSRGFIVRCIYCDDPGHKRGDCKFFADDMKAGLIIFREGMIRDAASGDPLATNFGKGGMKKLVDDKLGRTSSVRLKDAETYNIQAVQNGVEAVSNPNREVMIRGAQVIRSLTGWDDPVDSNTIRAYLGSENGEKEPHDVLVEVKRGRNSEEDTEEPASKKKAPTGKENVQNQGPAGQTRQRQEGRPSTSHPGDAPLPKEKWEERMSGNKKEKEDGVKGKGKSPAYRLQSDIESSIDMKGILEERILDAKIEFTLREALGIAKKDFHELIIDVIKRKRQITAETVMTNALDTHMTEDEEEEIGQVFALMCDHVNTEDHNQKVESISAETYRNDEGVEDLLDGEMEDEVLKMFAYGCEAMNTVEVKSSKNHGKEMVSEKDRETIAEEILGSNSGGEAFIEANVSCCLHNKSQVKRESETLTAFTHPFWARATTETRVKLGDLDESFLALVDHGSEINIISRKLYEKGKWPIDVNHGWVMRAANNEKGKLYGACPAVKTKIGNVEVEQNYFVQNYGSYPIILGQPYITATRMETKVLDDGSHYARIRSLDGMQAVQFLTVRSSNERHRDQLRDEPMDYDRNREDFQDF